MLLSFLTFFRRFITRNMLISLLKSMGLWLGMLVFAIVFLIFGFHHSYDNWNPDRDNIFKVSFQSPGGDYMGSDKYGVTSAVLAPTVNEKLPQVEYAVRIEEAGEILLKMENESFLVENVAAVDPKALDMIGVELLKGSQEAFLQPYSILLSESAALKLFGEDDPIGQVVNPESYREMSPYTIVGVHRDLPQNTTFNYDYILPFEDYLKDTNPNSLEQWGNRSYYTFFKIPDLGDIPQIEEMATQFRNEAQEDPDSEFRYFLQPLTELHFSEGINFEMGEPINSRNLDALLYIGIIILLISAFNVVNLSIAETYKRQMEMGVRKTFGATRGQIIMQYLFETTAQMIVITGLMVISLYLILPILNRTIEFDLEPFSNPAFLPLLGLMILVMVLLTSAYPALILSRFQAGKNLKVGVASALGVRNVLVVVQFLLAGTLMVVSIGIYQQINYLLDTDPGYQREGIMVVRIQDRDVRRDDETRRTIKLRALEHSQIEQVAYSSQLPNRITSQNGRTWKDDKGEERHVSLYTLLVEPGIMDIYDIQMADGRSFSEDFESNDGKYLLNEAAVKEIGIDDIMGQLFIENEDTIEIIGVMKDFHGLSMHQPIRPTRFSVENISWWQYCSVRFYGDPKPVEDYLVSLFNEYSDFPVTAELFDDNYARLYEEERQTRSRIAILTGLAIFISCLGLFGLLLNSFENRQRELGIRKTLGGELRHLGWILSRRLLIPIGLAWIVSMPLAVYLLENWLANFSYRTSPGLDSFIVSAVLLLVALAISLLYMLIRISRLNPVEILKVE